MLVFPPPIINMDLRLRRFLGSSKKNEGMFYRKISIINGSLVMISLVVFLYVLWPRSKDTDLSPSNAQNEPMGSSSDSLTRHHNSIRAKCNQGLKKLKRSADLERYASKYSVVLANAGGLSHHFNDHDSYKNKAAGENLAMACGTRMTKEEAERIAVNGWAGEGFSGTPNHYSAMNWKSADTLGCGTTQRGSCFFTACNYGASNGVLPNTHGKLSEVVCRSKLSL